MPASPIPPLPVPAAPDALQRALLASCRDVFERYVAGERQALAQVGMAAHGTAHHEARLDHLAIRAQRALHAVRQWQRHGRALHVGRYLHSGDIAAHFAPRFPVHALDLQQVPDEADFTALCERLRGAAVIVNNNDLGHLQLLQRLYLSCPDTLFIACLYDNHHTLELSATISLCADLVFPAHFDYLAVLNRYCPFVCGPLPASTMQWSRADAQRLEPLLYTTERSVALSGGFTHYPQFPFRNGIVRRIMSQPVGAALELPGQGGGGHHTRRSADDNWRVWAQSKVNLMVPTMTDLPHRFFDALLTGNVVLAPRWIQPFFAQFDFSAFDRPPVVWFDHADLADMAPRVAEAVALFDAEGRAGIAMRHRWVRDHHLLEHRLERMLDEAQALVRGRAATGPSTELIAGVAA